MTNVYPTALSRFNYPSRPIRQRRERCYWCGVQVPAANIVAIVREKELKRVKFCGNNTDCLENFVRNKDCNIERIL